MRNKQVMVKTLRDPSLIALHVAIPSMQSKDAPCDRAKGHGHGHHHKQTAIALATRIFCFTRRKKYFLND